jgi:hypothetical protein
MKILSIDVGIKNLACVILDFNETKFVPSKIERWEVLDLTDRVICSSELCNEVAYFKGENEIVYCKKHAKKNGGLLIPKPCDKLKNIKKLKMVELKEYAIFHGIKTEKLKKAEIFKKVEEIIKEKYYLCIDSSRADEYDLITLGRMLKIKMKEFVEDNEIDVVYIENQISPIANRMKTIQGMITQYFIMTSSCKIEFVSSINKLKELNMETSSYAERKKEGILLCKKKIEEFNNEWKDFFEKSKKKDDLSDCYLQGLFCIKRIREEKII